MTKCLGPKFSGPIFSRLATKNPHGSSPAKIAVNRGPVISGSRPDHHGPRGSDGCPTKISEFGGPMSSLDSLDPLILRLGVKI